MYITVKDFLEENANAAVDVFVSKGMVRLSAGLAQVLLTSSSQRMKLKANGAGDTITASELLDSIVTKVIYDRKQYNHYFLLTSTRAAVAESNYRPQIEFEQLEFDLSDLPPQWLGAGNESN